MRFFQSNLRTYRTIPYERYEIGTNNINPFSAKLVSVGLHGVQRLPGISIISILNVVQTAHLRRVRPFTIWVTIY